MERTFLTDCALGLALSLSACGGGGGGGSASGGDGGGGGGGTVVDRSQTGAAFTHKELAGDASAVSAPNSLSSTTLTTSALARGSGARNSLAAGLPMNNTAGYMLRVESNGTVALWSGGSSIAAFDANKMNFYSNRGVDFAVMSDTKPSGANATLTDFVWIGKMNFATFGYWARVSNSQGQKAYVSGDTFYFKSGPSVMDSSYANAHYNGSNLGTFRGIAAGMAKYDDKTPANADTVLPLMGTASLTIASATSGTLVLDFPGFYMLTGNVNTSTSSVVGTAGGFTGSFTHLTKYASGYAFPVDLPAISGFSGAGNANSIQGQLFGTLNGSTVNITNPGEASGTWRLMSSTAARDIEIIGAFGVQK